MTAIRFITLFALLCCSSLIAQEASRLRAREAGVVVGILPVGPQNAITDVAGVIVGHKTIIQGENIRTGITAILPHKGNLFREKVPGAVFVGNAFGKLFGSTQVNELGEIETPILLTSTLAVPRVADGIIDYMLALPGNEDVQSINPLVGETNDGWLNDIRARRITSTDVAEAIRGAKGGPVDEGAVGAGTGTVAFGFKGGIGTSSRKLPANLGGYTVGVLVQTNFGGVLTNAIAFSTNRQSTTLLSNDDMSPLFLAAIEATEEAVYNSLFKAKTTTGRGHTVDELPIDKTIKILKKYNAVK